MFVNLYTEQGQQCFIRTADHNNNYANFQVFTDIYVILYTKKQELHKQQTVAKTTTLHLTPVFFLPQIRIICGIGFRHLRCLASGDIIFPYRKPVFYRRMQT